MEVGELVEAIRRDGAGFVEAVADAGLDTPIPSCPEWNAYELLAHLGEVHAFWATVVEHRLQHLQGMPRSPQPPAGEQAIAWYRAGLDHLVAVLDAADATTPVWTWAGRKDVGFVVRRMAHETAVHRWDAEHAAGRSFTLDAALASDGIDEVLDDWLRLPPPPADLGGSVHVHCTDVEGEWLVSEASGGALEVSRQHAKGSCAMRGSAADLLLVLMKRRPFEAVDTVGDAAVGRRLVERVPSGRAASRRATSG